ncbi:MAG: hypothetical protein DRN17_05430 [Thermoplasmata archaeon]|nr:MAG: hypothetical protein DRN17_05430 [Thermoplasmata archaeon]
MSRRKAKGNVEVNSTLIALLIVADIALLIIWLIFALVVKRPFVAPGGAVLMAFLLILIILIRTISKKD